MLGWVASWGKSWVNFPERLGFPEQEIAQK
jgi:hypothetical protein